jgi:hypothetical protein
MATITVMAEIKTVGVKDLKNKLSAYLREVRTGVRLLVSDRDTVVAELHEPYLDQSSTASLNPPLSDWVKSRTVTLPTKTKEQLSLSPVCKPDGTALKLLDQDRGESGS